MKDGLQNGRRTAARIAAVAFLTIGMSTIGLSPVRGERATLQSVRIDGVPHFHQDEAFSGEACAAMFLSRGAGRVRPSDVFNRAEVDPRRGSGCRPRELRDALRRMGVETGTGYLVLIGEERTAVEREFSALGGDLARGVASIVALRPDPAAATTRAAAIRAGPGLRRGNRSDPLS